MGGDCINVAYEDDLVKVPFTARSTERGLDVGSFGIWASMSSTFASRVMDAGSGRCPLTEIGGDDVKMLDKECPFTCLLWNLD